jgi:hypothetical protein
MAFGVPLLAQKPANAPATATAQCTDGTFSTAKTEQNACSKHGGVKTWFGPAAAAVKDTKKGATETKNADKTAAKTIETSKAAAATGAGPKGSTGQCTDGSYTKAKTQTGACSQHGGVKTWFAAATAAAGAAAAPAAGVAPAPAVTPKAPPVTPKSVPVAPASGDKAAVAGKAAAAATQTPAVAKPGDAPADATGKCKDGTFTSSKTHSGACSHHGGVAEWFK